MALSLKEIQKWCKNEKKEFWEYMLYDDMRERGVTREESMGQMERTFDAMYDTVETYRTDRLSASGLVGAEGGTLEAYRNTPADKLAEKGKKESLCGSFMGDAMVVALKMAESNACMRRIVAAPTAGACGVIPAVLVPYYKRLLSAEKPASKGQDEEQFAKENPTAKDQIIKALYVSGAIGQVIVERASISGAQGGCQAEIGSASAMAAGALTYLQGGTEEQICHAAALALKGLMGLVCDPVAGLVEVPCVKRNVTGTVNAIACADMAMAGIQSRIAPDEVIDAMGEVGEKMDSSLKETALGGLAATPSGRKIAEKLGM